LKGENQLNKKNLYLFSSNDYFAKKLSLEDDLNLVQDLCKRCTDYYEHCEQRPTPGTAAEDIFTELPPEKTLEDKYVIGIFNKDNKLIGVIEGVVNFPLGSWFMGLMIIDPLYRNARLGENIFTKFKDWVQNSNLKEIRLGVIIENEKAIKFWKKLSFQEFKRLENYQIGDNETTVIAMKLDLN
jgi:RimJ/RimL family protein N-acetyltransferase